MLYVLCLCGTLVRRQLLIVREFINQINQIMVSLECSLSAYICPLVVSFVISSETHVRIACLICPYV